jgi:hypothetical protein
VGNVDNYKVPVEFAQYLTMWYLTMWYSGRQ